MNALVMVSGLGVLALLGEIFRFRKALYPLVLAGLIATFVVNLFDWDQANSWFGAMMVYDNYAVAFNQVVLTIAIGWLLMAKPFFSDYNHITDYLAVLMFALAGALVMTSFSNLSMFFIGLETLSISMYVMAGSRKTDRASNEAAMKYFLMGAFSTGFLLFGITLIYGASHTFDVALIRKYVIENQAHLPGIVNVGVLLLMVGLLFKVAAFPFHFWAPDVYEGSPAPITAFMATIVKVAAIAAFYRLFSTCFASLHNMWGPIIWVVSALTILVGNITALYQRDVKRMLAYSSVSHAGYILFALVAINRLSTPSLLYYSLAYSFATLSAFTVLMIVHKRVGNTHMDSFKGLAKNNPLLGLAMVVALLSLSGIPPLAGFFAKYYLFAAALQSNFLVLVLFGVIGSLVGVYYYFRVIAALFQDGNNYLFSIHPLQALFLVLSIIITILLGVLPNLVLGLW